MKREELKQIAELTDEQLDKIMAINGVDVEKVKAKVTALEADLKEAKETIDKTNTEFEALKSSNAGADEYKAKYEALVADNEAKAKQAEADRMAKEKAESDERLFNEAVGEKKFSHDAVKSHYFNLFRQDLAKEENKGKSAVDILHALTKDDSTAFAGVTAVKLQGGRPMGTGNGYSSVKDIMNSDMTREQKRAAIAENIAKGNIE
jgi:ribosomal protein L12E/L44/L45/RPP1/RPP2